MNVHEIINAEKMYAEKLNSIVQEAVREKELISAHLIEAESDRGVTFGQRMADRISTFGGSWAFIILFFIAITIWIVLNTVFWVTKPLDPYPYILLNLILSCLAALQAPVIMMSQNRQDEKDRRRERSDFLINLKAEMEVRNLQEKMDLLVAEQMKKLFEIQKEQLAILKRMEKENHRHRDGGEGHP